jgi:hypothetical protein
VNRNKIPNEVVEVHPLKTCRSEKAPSQEATETKPDPGMMQSVEEHQEIPMEYAAVIAVGGLRKRCRDRNLAAGCHQKPKKSMQASCESKRRSAATCRKVSHHARVAWRKRPIFRRSVIQGNCGPWSKLTAAWIMMTRHAEVAWRIENFFRKDCTRNQTEQKTPKQ